jgi:hypothetical protein
MWSLSVLRVWSLSMLMVQVLEDYCLNLIM